jgi:hypothetical protein
MMRWSALLALGPLLWGCPEKSGESLKSLAPPPLPALEQPAAGAGARGGADAKPRGVEAAPVFGQKLPEGALRLKLDSGREIDPSAAASAKVVLLEPDADVYLAQVQPLLEALDDGGVETWLLHPAGGVAFKLLLRDEAAFQAWLDEPRPGKIRVIQRADGYELSTNVGKLPGPDPNGPSVPIRGGQLDLATLRRGLGLLRDRFKKAEDVCIVPSFGTELQKVALSLSSFFEGADDPIFGEQCLVYPRPPRKDGG